MGLIVLLAQCVAMFVASMLVGSLPLMFKSAQSERSIKAVSVFGMGILVGAALTIIIPEGVSTLIDSITEEGTDEESITRAIGLSLLSGFALMLLIESLTPHPPHSHPSSPSITPPTPSTPLNRDSMENGRPNMTHLNSQTPIMPKRLHVQDHHHDHHVDSIRGLNATLGMVIHGAADGIALGASSLSSNSNLGLIVFLAVLVHKGPTALGLTTTLLSLRLDHVAIRKRLLIFSCAAPLGAIITYALVSVFGSSKSGLSGGEGGTLQWWTGIALLFSGGSFLYVATVIQPLSSSDPSDHSHDHHPNEGPDPDTLSKYTRAGLLVSGMILPPILSLIVGDQH